MTPLRFQPLRSAYKALCSLLYNTAAAIEANDYTLAGVSANVIEKVNHTLLVFEYQTAAEEAVLFSAIHDYEPALMAILCDHHRERMYHVQQLQDTITTGNHAQDIIENILSGARLTCFFNEFVTCCVQQMNEHEPVINRVLWKYYTDEELEQIAVSIKPMQPLPERRVWISSEQRNGKFQSYSRHTPYTVRKRAIAI